MGEWKEYKLKDAPFEIIDGDRGRNYPSQDEFYQSGYCLFLSTKNVRKTGFDFLDCQFIVEAKDKALRKGKLRRFDTVLTTRGTVGNVAFFGGDVPFDNIRINSGMVIIRPNDAGMDPKYCFYLFRQLQESFETFTTGSAQPQLPIRDLSEMDIVLPDLPEQKSIASILSSLDDKIDLLHRQNKTLEALAETLFRQWFMEEAEDGWKAIKVKDVCKTITKGTTPTTLGNSFIETGVNFLKAESLTDEGDLLENKFAHINEATHEKLSRSKLEANDLIITIAGTIGRVAIVPERVLPANTNQALAILRLAENTISHLFLYCLFKSTEVRNDFESRVVHAVQPNLSLGEIGDISFKLPSKEKLEFGEKALALLFQKKEKNNIQIRILTRLRDTLLPKLMSGEVRVRLEEK